MKFYRGDLRVDPNFAGGSQAATQQAGSPAKISASEILLYSKEDDNFIDEYHRCTGSYSPVQVKFAAGTNTFGLDTTWHSVRK